MSSTLLRTSTISVEGYSRLLGRLLDIKDIRILNVISEVSTRNISEIARKANLPITTTYRRIHTLRRYGLRYRPSIIPEKIGLTRVITIIEKDIGMATSTIPATHWLSTHMPLVSHLGAMLVYYTPIDRPTLIEYYLRRAKKDSLISDYQIIPIINAFNSPKNLNRYYDVIKRYIIIPWSDWLRVLEEENKLSESVNKLPPLMFKPEPSMPKDSLDLLILKELEVDALASYAEIARKVNVPEYTVRFHYYSHLKVSGVIYNYVTRVPLFKLSESYYLAYFIKFSSYEGLEKIISIFWESPILLAIARLNSKIYDLVMWFLIPTSEAGKLSVFFKRAMHLGYVKRVRPFVIDWTNYLRKSIPYKNFDGDLKRWIDKP